MPWMEGAELIAAARHFAEDKHAGQERPCAPGTPYVVHLRDVAERVERAGGDDITIAAAWLHDVREDQGVSEDELIQRFGWRAAGVVDTLTVSKYGPNGQKRDWLSRKEEALGKFHPIERDSRYRAIQTSEPLAFWGRFNAHPLLIIGYERKRLLAARQYGRSHPLVSQLEQAYQRLLAATGLDHPSVRRLHALGNEPIQKLVIVRQKDFGPDDLALLQNLGAVVVQSPYSTLQREIVAEAQIPHGVPTLLLLVKMEDTWGEAPLWMLPVQVKTLQEALMLLSEASSSV